MFGPSIDIRAARGVSGNIGSFKSVLQGWSGKSKSEFKVKKTLFRI